MIEVKYLFSKLMAILQGLLYSLGSRVEYKNKIQEDVMLIELSNLLHSHALYVTLHYCVATVA